MKENPSDQDQAKWTRLATATSWQVRLAEANLSTTSEFEAWLAEDFQNAEAWRQVHESWAFFGEQAASPAILALRQSALSDARRAAARKASSLFRSRRILLGGIACSAAAAAGATWWLHPFRQIFQTSIGERRVLSLRDGSRVSLDADSRIDLEFTQDKRRVLLERGRARFEVARDLKRPFTVAADSREIVALGTVFDVDRFRSRLEVTLLEGHLAILSASNGNKLRRVDNPNIELQPGQRFIGAPSGGAVLPIDVERAAAWTQGLLVAENESLSDVIARMRRYSSRKITIYDSDTAALRVSGVFNTNNVDGFIDTIANYLPIVITAQPDGEVQIREKKI
jgi:transmembrane sensor